MIDPYCERVGDGYFAEPINAISNLVFLVAAYYAWKWLKKNNNQDIEFLALIALMVAIGFGSLSFHIYASGLSQLADLVPIFLFQLCYLWLYIRLVWGYRWPARLLLGLVLLVSIAISSSFQAHMNGSLLYAPTLAVLAIISVYHTISSKAAGLANTALLVFSLALVFRTVDRELCPVIDIGTHFIWHLLNGLVIYLLFKLLVIYRIRDKTRE
jgi:hypothetical protein